MAIFLPGSTIGILGSGQLARMLCLDAHRFGYKTVVWSGGGSTEPTNGVATRIVTGGFDCEHALEDFCTAADVATVEFENIPSKTLRAVEARIPLRPGAHAVEISQNRAREKLFLSEMGMRTAPFALVNSLTELEAAYAEIGPDAVLKTAESGYDGRGQVRLRSADELTEAWCSIDGQPAVLEGFVDFVMEASVLVSRSVHGVMNYFDVSENEHRSHILDLSIVPARLDEKTSTFCQTHATQIIRELDYVGLLAVEYFIQADGGIVVNEIAPRPHNSGHFTMDAAVTSQFEQQLRTVVGLEPGEARLLQPVAMLNLLGDMWHDGELDALAITQTPAAKLHLYNKSDASPRRKMGHVNCLADTIDEAVTKAVELKSKLLRSV